MKKLLALLLVLMTPLCTMAEAYRVSFTVDAGEEAFLQAMQAVMPSESSTTEAADIEREAALVQTLLDGLGVDMVVDETAASVSMRLCGKQFFDATSYEIPGKVLLTTSLLPGYALATPAAESDAVLLAEAEWSKAALSSASGLDAWLAGLNKTESRGVFVGDAYSGGTKCTTWQLSDKDITALLDAVLTEDMRSAMNTIYAAAGLEYLGILDGFDAANAKAAEENRHSYILRTVKDDADQLIGISLTIREGEKQLATTSLGVRKNGCKLVIGLGTNGQNYWFELVSAKTTADDTSTCDVSVREWAASKDEAFAYVQGTAAPANTWTWHNESAAADHKKEWTAQLAANGRQLLSAACTVDEAGQSAEGHISFGTGHAELARVTFSFEPAEAIPALDEAVVECSTTDPADAALYEKLDAQLTAAVMARLLKILPIDQLMQLEPFTMP